MNVDLGIVIYIVNTILKKINYIMEKHDLLFLRQIYEKCDSDKLYSSEDMMYAIENIREMIEEKYPQISESIPSMLLYCPIDSAVVEYDRNMELFICTECGWHGFYYETIKER